MIKENIPNLNEKQVILVINSLSSIKYIEDSRWIYTIITEIFNKLKSLNLAFIMRFIWAVGKHNFTFTDSQKLEIVNEIDGRLD